MADLKVRPTTTPKFAVVRLHRAGAPVEYYREDVEDLARGIVGIFRRAYVMQEPSELAKRVYDIASNDKLFRKLWSERSVEESIFHSRDGALHQLMGRADSHPAKIFPQSMGLQRGHHPIGELVGGGGCRSSRARGSSTRPSVWTRS